MRFTETTRELIGDRGFLLHKESGAVYDHAVYLGKYDSPDNYEDCDDSAYSEYLEKIEKQEEECGEKESPAEETAQE